MRSSLQEGVSIETVRDQWDQISDLKDSERPPSIEQALAKFQEALENMEVGTVPTLNTDAITRENIADSLLVADTYKYNINAAILYAISGTCICRRCP